jgi:hypothetical protein
MNNYRSRLVLVALSCAALVAVTACGIDVREDERGGRKAVDIRTPVGDVSVRTNVQADTGLAIYPGALPRRDGDEPETANVTVNAPFGGVRVVAASFTSNDTPDAVVTFYKNEMEAYGVVTECHGNIDFKRGQPVCKGRIFKARETQLVAGTEDRHRIVVVKPRRAGSEFSVVYIQSREG